MAQEIKREVKLEIVHVLFIDIVGYSKALTDEQQELVDRLNQVVRGSEEFQKAADADRLIRFRPATEWRSFFTTARNSR